MTRIAEVAFDLPAHEHVGRPALELRVQRRRAQVARATQRASMSPAPVTTWPESATSNRRARPRAAASTASVTCTPRDWPASTTVSSPAQPTTSVAATRRSRHGARRSSTPRASDPSLASARHRRDARNDDRDDREAQRDSGIRVLPRQTCSHEHAGFSARVNQLRASACRLLSLPHGEEARSPRRQGPGLHGPDYFSLVIEWEDRRTQHDHVCSRRSSRTDEITDGRSSTGTSSTRRASSRFPRAIRLRGVVGSQRRPPRRQPMYDHAQAPGRATAPAVVAHRERIAGSRSRSRRGRRGVDQLRRSARRPRELVPRRPTSPGTVSLTPSATTVMRYYHGSHRICPSARTSKTASCQAATRHSASRSRGRDARQRRQARP